MPRKRRHLPAYLHHKPSGQARVRIGGRDHYLGPYGSQESHDKYDDLIADLVAAPDRAATALTISELLAHWWRYCKKRYSRHGKGRLGNAVNWRPIIRFVREQYGELPVLEFSPKKLKALLADMPEHWSRQYCNQNLKFVKRIFKWGVSEELVPVAIYQALLTVSGIKLADSDRREMAPVQPVSDEVVDTTVQHLPALVAAMVRFQRLTGARPGEVCNLRVCDVNRTGEIWTAQLCEHKTRHHGHTRTIFIGPQAQVVLAPLLLKATNYVFAPKRSRHGRYTTDSYRRVIHRVCEEAGIARWSPGQIRHTTGTAIRDAFDVEHAQAILGHRELSTTQVYAEVSRRRALEAARRLG